MVDWGCQDNTVCFDALVNDLIDHVVLLDAVDVPFVQAVITGHAGMDAGAGLKDFEFDPFLCKFRRHDIKTLCYISALTRGSVNGNNFHFGSPPYLSDHAARRNGGST